MFDNCPRENIFRSEGEKKRHRYFLSLGPPDPEDLLWIQFRNESSRHDAQEAANHPLSSVIIMASSSSRRPSSLRRSSVLGKARELCEEEDVCVVTETRLVSGLRPHDLTSHLPPPTEPVTYESKVIWRIRLTPAPLVEKSLGSQNRGGDDNNSECFLAGAPLNCEKKVSLGFFSGDA